MMNKNLKELSKEILFESNDESIEENRFCERKDEEYEELAKTLQDNKKCILVFGINPAGDSDPKCGYFYEYISNEKMKEALKEKEAVYDKYFKPNYELFDNKQVTMKWVLREKSDLENDFGSDFDNKYYKDELDKKFVLVFSDLIYYHCTDYRKIKKLIFKKFGIKKIDDSTSDLNEELKKLIKSVIEKHIELLNPQLIVVTNSFASKLISKSLGNNEFVTKTNYKEVKFIFSGMVSGGNMDVFSRKRLMEDIEEEMKKINKR